MYPSHSRSRYRVEIRPAATTLDGEPRISVALSRRNGGRRVLVERAALLLGALGIVGFVASNLGIAAGLLEPAKYLALSLASIAEYSAALVIARSATRGAWEASIVAAPPSRVTSAHVISVAVDDDTSKPSTSST